tara:strand:+ start:1062 stop:1799 length:738 start_codon:yes stop_codon:yes gene_type:complete
MTTIFMFDVDGTLTPARTLMLEEHQRQFIDWSKDKSVYLVSGSDLRKIKEQLPPEVLNCCAGIYASMGNCYYEDGVIRYSKLYSPSLDLIEDLEGIVESTEYEDLAGEHIEYREGMINFSVVGRAATMEQRAAYAEWDAKKKDRKVIVDALSMYHPHLDFVIGGKISIDIFPKGYDKSQAAKHRREEAGKDTEIVFFGDRTDYPGNDYAIVSELDRARREEGLPSKWYAVEEPGDTFKILRDLYA